MPRGAGNLMKTLRSFVRTLAAACAFCWSLAAWAAPYTINVSASPASGSPIGTGQVITYTITITNGGVADTTSGNGFIRMFMTSATQTAFQFNPAVPNGIATQPGGGSAWAPCTITPNGNGTNQFTCYAGDGIGGGADSFAANQSVVIKVDALVASTATDGSVLNQTAFFETDVDGNGVDEVFIGSNTVSNLITHYETTDLGITKVTSNPTPTAGGAAFSYTLTVTNYGPGDAIDVEVVDPLPPGIVFHNVAVVNNSTTAGFGLICTGPPNATNGTVKCTGNLAAPINTQKSTATITIVAQAVANVASGVRTNTATVRQDREWSPDAQPNTASVQQNILVDAPLSISLLATPTVIVGDPILYQVTVNNGGSSDAINPTITLPLPTGTQFLGLYGSHALHATCNATGGGLSVVCHPKSIPTGQHHLVVIAETFVGITPTGPLPATATINTAGTGTIAVGTAPASTTSVQNQPPHATNDAYLTNMDTPLVVATLGVKTNDTDDEDLKSVLSAALVNGPAHGTLTVPLSADGHFTYTPNAGYTGADSFTYTVTDSRGLVSNTGTVNITVNAPPVAVDDAYITDLNTPLVVPSLGVKSNDSDDLDTLAALAASLVAGPAHGTLSVPLAANGSFTYTPNPGYTGPDSFTYRVTDTGGLISNTATVSITVNAPPVAVDDKFFMSAENNSTHVPPLGVKANDTDDADPPAALIATLVTPPQFGTLQSGLNADGSFVYIPAPGIFLDSFTYTVTDTRGLVSNVATVTIVVQRPVPIPPWALGLLLLMLSALAWRALSARLPARAQRGPG